MIFLALLRYQAVEALRATRWVAPLVVFLIVTVSGTTAGGTALGGYGLTATALMPVALWLTVVVLNGEDPVQSAITSTTVGNPLTVRLGGLTVAYLGCQVLTAFAVVWPPVTGHPAGAGDIGAGVAGHLLTSLAGVAVGSVLARPVVRRPAWAVVLGVAVIVAEFVVPGSPPVGPIAAAFADTTGDTPGGVLALAAAQTVIGTAVLIGVGHRLSRRQL